MSRLSTVFALGGLSLLLSPLVASAQFVRPYGLPGGVPFMVPLVPTVPIIRPVTPVTPIRPVIGWPQYYQYQYTQYNVNTIAGGFGYRSFQFAYGSPAFAFRPVTLPLTQSAPYYPASTYSSSGREDILLAEQQNLERAQKAATVAASLAPTGAVRSLAAGGVLDAGPLPEVLNQALTPADAAQIASGVALNRLLKEIVQAESKGAKGPSAYIPPLLIKDIRFAGSPTSDLMNFARQDALEFPSAFDAGSLATARAELAKHFTSATEILRTGKVPEAGRVGQLGTAFQRFEEASAPVLKQLPNGDAKVARDFLARLGGAIEALKDGSGNGLINPNWMTEGLTGSELVRHMTKYKLEFGPAPQGAIESYETMHRNLSTYLFVLTKAKK